MSVNEVLSLYPTLIPVLKEAGLVHRSQITSIKVHREKIMHKLHFMGDREYDSSSGGFTVKCGETTIKITCDFDGNKIIKPRFEFE